MDNINEIKRLAVEKAIDILAKYNLKYRQFEFDDNANKITINGGSVVIELSYLYGNNRGRSLKSMRKIIKTENKNISLSDEYIAFHFYLTELEPGGKESGILTDSDIELNQRNQAYKTNENDENEDNKIIKIHASDMLVIEDIAKKYNISLRNLAQIITQEQTAVSKKLIHVRFTEQEIKIVDKKAKNAGMSRSGLCRYACLKVINEYTKMKDINLKKIEEGHGTGSRNIRVCVSFKNIEEKRKINEFADNLSLSYSSFIRFCMLNI